MIELYMSNGVSEIDAIQTIKTLSYYPEFFVSLMMAQELRMAQPESTPWNLAIANFLGFNLFYFLPLGSIYGYITYLLPICLSSFVSSSSLSYTPSSSLLWLWSLPQYYNLPSITLSSFTSITSFQDILSLGSLLFIHIPPTLILLSIFIINWTIFHYIRMTSLPIYKHTNTSINIGTTAIIAATIAGILAYSISPIMDVKE